MKNKILYFQWWTITPPAPPPPPPGRGDGAADNVASNVPARHQGNETENNDDDYYSDEYYDEDEEAIPYVLSKFRYDYRNSSSIQVIPIFRSPKDVDADKTQNVPVAEQTPQQPEEKEAHADEGQNWWE